MKTDLPFPRRSGKVRDVYDLGDSLLIIATDRISAFDVIMPNGIPDKGKILTAISLFWFQRFADELENHLIATETSQYPATLQTFAPLLQGRSMLVKKAAVVPFECVARGYLAGSGWKEYQSSGAVCGMPLPAGLRQAERLPQPIFTPATKAEAGHDQNVPFETMVAAIGIDLAKQLRETTLKLYTQAADEASSRGVIIADTKFEFGLLQGRPIVIDEMLTPDSSRFWPADQYRVGISPPSLDKQYMRDWLEAQPWSKTPPAPTLPEAIVSGTRERYLDAYHRLTGQSFE